MSERYTLIVQEDPETKDLILEFPDSLMESTGWKIGDTLEWVPQDNGSWLLRKQQDHADCYYDTERNR